MLHYIGHRLLQLIPLLIAISIIAFVIIQLPPGDYLTTYINQLKMSGNEVSEGTVQALKKQYGLSGPAIKPVAIRMIYEVSQKVNIPIIGMGGIETVEDIIEYFYAGASAVAIGTLNFTDPFICQRLIAELPGKLDELGVLHISELVGRSWK